MAGHMGDARITDQEGCASCAPTRTANLLLVKGTVPGARNALMLVRKA